MSRNAEQSHGITYLTSTVRHTEDFFIYSLASVKVEGSAKEALLGTIRMDFNSLRLLSTWSRSSSQVSYTEQEACTGGSVLTTISTSMNINSHFVM